jgi:sugar lactone lactonase YvrE
MSLMLELFVDCRAELGEGPLWDHRRSELVWFDIGANRMFAADIDGVIRRQRAFDQPAAAAALLGPDGLAVVKAGAIVTVSADWTVETRIAPFETGRPGNRPNDCRVHRSGQWWLSSMDQAEEAATGSLYRLAAGQLVPVRADIEIANAICFSPDGGTAYFTDTPTRRILKRPLDPQSGRTTGPWSLFADVSDGPGFPDGATVDSEGCLWSARWGGGCVVRHAPDGRAIEMIELPVANVSCPAFGGDDLRTLFMTTAHKGLTAEERAEQPYAGSVFAARVDTPGVPEPLLKL